MRSSSTPELATRQITNSLKVAAIIIFIDLEIVPLTAMILRSQNLEAGYLVLAISSLAITMCLFIPHSKWRLVLTAAALIPFIALAADQLDSPFLLHAAAIPFITIVLCLRGYGVPVVFSIQLHLEAVLVLLGKSAAFTDFLPVVPLAAFWPLSILLTLISFPLMGFILSLAEFGLSLPCLWFTVICFALEIFLTIVFFKPIIRSDFPLNFYIFCSSICLLGLFAFAGCIKSLTRFSVLGEENVHVVMNRPPLGLTTSELRRLASRRIKSGDAALERACTICQEVFGKGDSVMQLEPCKHHFHASCLRRWLRRKATCPNCNCWLKLEGACLQRDETHNLIESGGVESSLTVPLLLPPVALLE